MIHFEISPEDLELLRRIPLPIHSRAWLTRGYIRASMLGDLQPLDDLDIVVAASVEQLEVALGGLVERRTMHGGFSLRKIGNRSVDVWSLSNTYGVPCEEVGQALLLFEFSCDAFAVEIDGGELVSNGSAAALIKGKTFDVQTHYPFFSGRADFLLTKGIYLCLRHEIDPGPVLSALFREPITISGPNTEAIAQRFGNELKELDRLSNSTGLLAKYPRLEDRLSLMLCA